MAMSLLQGSLFALDLVPSTSAKTSPALMPWIVVGGINVFNVFLSDCKNEITVGCMNAGLTVSSFFLLSIKRLFLMRANNTSVVCLFDARTSHPESRHLGPGHLQAWFCSNEHQRHSCTEACCQESPEVAELLLVGTVFSVHSWYFCTNGTKVDKNRNQYIPNFGVGQHAPREGGGRNCASRRASEAACRDRSRRGDCTVVLAYTADSE